MNYRPMPWSSKFEDLIPLPNGRKLITLKDAGTYITKLPKAEHDAPEWQAANGSAESWWPRTAPLTTRFFYPPKSSSTPGTIQIVRN